MRLKKSKTSAEEELTALINEGYTLLNWIRQDYQEKRANNSFDTNRDNQLYETAANGWGNKVIDALNSVFPTELEANSFLNPPSKVGFVVDTQDIRWQKLIGHIPENIRALDRIIADNLSRYTDLPIQSRLFVEDIDSFRKVRDVNPAAVSTLLGKDGYLDLSEDAIQMALEQILNVSFHKKDWGGEINDLYTCNVTVNGGRVETAFLLKGNGLKSRTLRIKDCGANGDQLVRLFDSPARLFVVQFVGVVDEAVIRDVQDKVDGRRAQGKSVWFCIMDGQDTARLLRAYGKL